MAAEKHGDTREDAARYRALLEANPDALVAVDLRGAITKTNSAFEQMTGHSSDELAGAKVFPFFDDPERAREGFERILANGTLKDFPIRIMHRSGDATAVYFNAALLRGEDGESIGALGVARDLTHLRRAEAQLEEAHGKLRAHLDNFPVGMIEWDDEQRIMSWSAGAERIFGWSAEQTIGKTIDRDIKLIHDEDEASVGSVMERVLAGEKRVIFENRNYREDGSVIHCEWHNSVLREERGRVVSIMSLALDVTPRKRLEADLRRLADRDSLTGLFNRRAFMERLNGALARLKRTSPDSRRGLAVLYLDLDGFKPVNDLHGHAAGDKVLREVANRLSGCFREGDTLARLGGDEFAAILEGAGGSEEGAYSAAERVLRAVETPFSVSADSSVRVGVSTGVAVASGEESSDELLRRADKRMYRTKTSASDEPRE